MGTTETVLIVEDDVKLAALLEAYLQGQGFAVSVCGDGETAIERVLQTQPGLVVLDLMLPKRSGLDVLKAVRERYAGGILMLTATKTEVEQIVGLELGADDYVTKPVEPRVLLARLRSLSRRVHKEVSKGPVVKLRCGLLELDRSRHEVTVEQRVVELTAVEFKLLWFLAEHAGEIVTRDELYTEVLGTRYDGLDRGVDVHLSRLRKKLAEKGFAASSLKSVRGSGYLLVRP